VTGNIGFEVRVARVWVTRLHVRRPRRITPSTDNSQHCSKENIAHGASSNIAHGASVDPGRFLTSLKAPGGKHYRVYFLPIHRPPQLMTRNAPATRAWRICPAAPPFTRIITGSMRSMSARLPRMRPLGNKS
jgi:hypothetical protein